MWTNTREIPNNGKDDDKNGYVDDVHGWNFIGGKNGENVNEDNLEMARVYKALKEKYEGKRPQDYKTSKEKEECKLFLSAKTDWNSSVQKLINLQNVICRYTTNLAP